MKLNAACYASRTVKLIMSQVLVMVYVSYLYSNMSYGMVFWGASSHSINICRLQKGPTAGLDTEKENPLPLLGVDPQISTP
jgi:hypothetical protein